MLSSVSCLPLASWRRRRRRPGRISRRVRAIGGVDVHAGLADATIVSTRRLHAQATVGDRRRSRSRRRRALLAALAARGASAAAFPLATTAALAGRAALLLGAKASKVRRHSAHHRQGNVREGTLQGTGQG